MKILNEEKLKLFKDSSSGKYYVYKDGKFKEVKIDPSSSSSGGGKGVSISIPSEEDNNNDNSSSGSNDQDSKEQDSKENKSSSSSKSSDKKDDNSSDSESQGGDKDNEKNKSSDSSSNPENSEPTEGGGKDDNIEPYKDVPSEESKDDEVKKNSSSNKKPPKPLSIGDKGDNAKEMDKKWDAEEDAKEREERVAKIKKILDDPDQMNDAIIEITRVAKKSAKKSSNPTKDNIEGALNRSGYNKGRSLKEFQQSLIKMIRRQIAPSYETTYSKLNKKYDLKSTGVLMPGRRENTRGKIPLIDVYFDVSGSCRPYVDLIQNYISILNGLEQKNKIKIDLYYCASSVTKDINGAGYAGANADQIMNNIAKTGADNVIIITDSDPDGSPSSLNIEVKGCVWFIWVHGRYSDNLITHLRGRAGTESFTISD